MHLADSYMLECSQNSTWLITSRHDTTRHVRRVEPMPKHDELDWLDTQLSLLCNSYKVMIRKLFIDLLEYAFI